MSLPFAPPLTDASALELLTTWRLDPGWTLLSLGLLLGYFWLYRRHGSWEPWRIGAFLLGLLVLNAGLQSEAVRYSQASMALYMARLMLLAELAPPLLLLGLPADAARSRSKALGVILDPWVALAVWTTVIVVWNLPMSFSASLVSNTAAMLLPGFYLLGGLMTWAVTLDRLPQSLPKWRRGVFGLLSSLPMMLVGLVWLFASSVLYAPYVGAICLWNYTPLQNQQLSGVVMLVAGVPLMLLAAWQLAAQGYARLQEWAAH
ncbi:MAG: cytochrome c oxidase assembly protein, partial [Deinococcus sp.]|nr:cytochrome c oxidase assembly protein [Deinococcus sp.]